MKEISHFDVHGDYDVRTGILIEYTTTYYTDGTSYTETRIVDTHQAGWESNR
jgi:hypothetical protein